MKPLAGKRWFYSLGQRSIYPAYIGPRTSDITHQWALDAFNRGQRDERWSRARNTVKTWPVSKLAEAA